MKMPNGEEFKTTFWEDFTIAGVFGDDAIQDTYNRAFAEWKEDLEYITELVIVLNMKCWQCFETGATERSSLYADLYYKTNDYVYDWLEKTNNREGMNYYFRMTD